MNQEPPSDCCRCAFNRTTSVFLLPPPLLPPLLTSAPRLHVDINAELVAATPLDPPAHAETASLYNAIAHTEWQCYIDSGETATSRKERAEQAFEKCLSVLRTCYGASHPTTQKLSAEFARMRTTTGCRS